MSKNGDDRNSADVATIINNFKKPKKAVVTAVKHYAKGQLHHGQLVGAHIPADIYARWLRMLIGKENVLFVCGTDDHGSTSEVAALTAKVSIHDFINQTHAKQKITMSRYHISLDTYTGTSRPECFPHHKELSQNFIRNLMKNGMLEKRTSKQWFDPSLNRFLQDRYVRGKCPNEKCDNESAYSDDCDKCGMQYDPSALINPKSALSDATPVLKDTVHWWLDLWKVADPLRVWIQSKAKKWRTAVYNEVIGTVMPAFSFSNKHEPWFKEVKESLPKHKSRYAPGKKIVIQFESMSDLEKTKEIFSANSIEIELLDAWAHRSITRDVSWGIPLPVDLDPDMEGKTLYVWPDSLIAPISFSKVALLQKGENPERIHEFWNDPEARVCQFLGQDNVYFYVLMQGAMWLGQKNNPQELPIQGDLQMTDIFGNFHLLVDGEKMSKSRGNFYTGDQMLDEKGYSADQIRYYLALLSLPEKSSSFDFKTFEERNKFLAGPLNASFEKPISALHSKFQGEIPSGEILEKAQKETVQIVQKYLNLMEKGNYSQILFAVENYARLINSFFVQYKPHDDRFPEKERSDAIVSCFYILKNLMIMLYPFAPETMDRLRKTLNLSEDVFQIKNLGTGFEKGHLVNPKEQYFPMVDGVL